MVPQQLVQPRRVWLVALLVVVLVLTGCSRTRQPAPTPSPAAPTTPGVPDPIATSTGPFQAGPVAPPASGAYLGAWVRPDVLTQPRRIEAVSTMETDIGRQLDIVNTYRRMHEPFFTDSDLAFIGKGSTLMLSWAGEDTRSITAGNFDAEIHDRARAVAKFGKPMLLRFRWEMDRPGMQASMWSPEDYIAAWKYVRDIFRAEKATNASWVWCPTAEGFTGGYAQPFYPGDEEVDWICVDVYAGQKLVPMGELLKPYLQFTAKHPTKPAMIGEFGVSRPWGSTARAAWIRDAGQVFKANAQIRAVLYFNSDPDNANGPNQHFQITDDAPALAAFTELARDPYFNPRR